MIHPTTPTWTLLALYSSAPYFTNSSHIVMYYLLTLTNIIKEATVQLGEV